MAVAQGGDTERERLREIERRLEDRRREEARLRDEAKEKAREVEALRKNMIDTADALQSAERRIVGITEELESLESEEAALTASLNEQREHLGDILGALQSLERSRPPALLVSPDDSVTAARAAMLLADAAPELKAKADELQAAIQRLAAVQTALAEERAQFEKTNEEIGARRQVLADLLRSKQRERSVAERLAQAAQGETAALAARASTLRGVLTRLERLARSIVPRLKPTPNAPQDGTKPVAPRRAPSLRYAPKKAFSLAKGSLRPPVVGDIIGRFGEAKPDGGKYDGVRFVTADDAIVTAPYDASVEFAQFWPGTGNLMVLNVGSDYHVLLMGVGSFLVNEGQTVAAGEPVAVMSGGAVNLDLEIRKAREPVNPALWLMRKTGG